MAEMGGGDGLVDVDCGAGRRSHAVQFGTVAHKGCQGIFGTR